MPDSERPTFRELAREFLSSTERGYDLLAPKFDSTPFRTRDAVLEAAAAAVESGAADSVLDLCCGTGAAMLVFRRLARERVVGLDMSAGMLAVARERLAAQDGGARVELVRGDALAMPFAAEFDLVISFGALGHFEAKDQARFAREIARVLRPGGRFVTIAPDRARPCQRRYWAEHAANLATAVRNLLLKPPFIMYYGHWSWPRMKRVLEEAGFSVEVRDLALAKPYSRLRLLVAARAAAT